MDVTVAVAVCVGVLRPGAVCVGEAEGVELAVLAGLRVGVVVRVVVGVQVSVGVKVERRVAEAVGVSDSVGSVVGVALG